MRGRLLQRFGRFDGKALWSDHRITAWAIPVPEKGAVAADDTSKPAESDVQESRRGKSKKQEPPQADSLPTVLLDVPGRRMSLTPSLFLDAVYFMMIIFFVNRRPSTTNW
jgi:hypothetical protein